MMDAISYELTPRDVLFFRDARPMDTLKRQRGDLRMVGHGANWPRPDLLFSAVIHTLLGDPERPEAQHYGSVKELVVRGPFPLREGTLYLPRPLDWDMRVMALPAGTTDLPAPLTHGFLDNAKGKKSRPQWVSAEGYARYLRGEPVRDVEPEVPALWDKEARVGTTLDDARHASVRDRGQVSGQWWMETLRLAPGVTMLCDVRQEKAATLAGRDVRFGGQGGTARFDKARGPGLEARLRALPQGKPSRFVRWTLLAPALFMKGWYPNWLDEAGHVMLPMKAVERRPGESRKAWRARAQAERKPFPTARLIAARIDSPVVFSGWDSVTRAKPTELAVPAGACYVFECADVAEAAELIKVLHLRQRSDLGEKGFGLGVCSYFAV